MKFSVLNPTEENIRETLLNDQLGRFEELSQFVRLLNSIDDNCTIALDGDWGSGKTFFIKQVQMIIDAYNGRLDKTCATDIQGKFGDINRVSQITVYYDAWENDGEADPLLSILYEIITAFDYDIKNFYTNEAGQIPKTLLTSIFERLSIKYLNVSVKDTLGKLSSENPFAQIQNNKDLKEEISNFLQEIKIERGDKLIIFVDELDRCNPTYAVKTLERIKHYFSSPDIIFVFAINSRELQNTIKQYYGTDFNAYQYLDRFFDLKIDLKLIDINKFIELRGLWSDDEYKMDICYSADRVLAKFYHFSMRMTDRYFKQVRIIQKNVLTKLDDFHDKKQQHAYYFLCVYVAPILVALKLYSINEYEEFINGNRQELFTNICNAYYNNIGLKNDFDTLFTANTSMNNVFNFTIKELYEYIFTKNPREYAKQFNDYMFLDTMIQNFLLSTNILSRFSNFE